MLHKTPHKNCCCFYYIYRLFLLTLQTLIHASWIIYSQTKYYLLRKIKKMACNLKSYYTFWLDLTLLQHIMSTKYYLLHYHLISLHYVIGVITSPSNKSLDNKSQQQFWLNNLKFMIGDSYKYTNLYELSITYQNK